MNRGKFSVFVRAMCGCCQKATIQRLDIFDEYEFVDEISLRCTDCKGTKLFKEDK